MTTKYYVASAIAVQKSIRLTVGGDFDKPIKIGLGPKLLTVNPFNLDTLVLNWNSSDDPLLSEISAVGGTDDGNVVFTHNTAGQDFELTMLIGDTEGVEYVDSSFLDEIQQIVFSNNVTGGTFTLSFNGQTTGAITYNAGDSAVTVANILAALEALSNVGIGDVQVTADSLTSFKVAFANGQYASVNVPLMTVDFTNLTGGNAAVVITTIQNGDLGTNEVQELSIPGFSSYTAQRNEIQTISLENANGGTFTLTLDSYGTTGPIPYNAGRTTLQTIMRAAFGQNEVSVLGPALPDGPLRITFTGLLSGIALPALTADITDLESVPAYDIAVTRTVSAVADTDGVTLLTRPGGIASANLADYDLVFKNRVGGVSIPGILMTGAIDGNSNAAAIKAAIIGAWDYEVPGAANDEVYGYAPGNIFTTDDIDVSGDFTTGGGDGPLITIKNRFDNWQLGPNPRLSCSFIKKSDSTETPVTGSFDTAWVKGTAEVQKAVMTTALPTVGNLYLTVNSITTRAIALTSNMATLALNMTYALRDALGEHYDAPPEGFFSVIVTAHTSGFSFPQGAVVPYPFSSADLSAAFGGVALETLFAFGGSDYNTVEVKWVAPLFGQDGGATWISGSEIPTTYAQFKVIVDDVMANHISAEGNYTVASFKTSSGWGSNPVAVVWDVANEWFTLTFSGWPFAGLGVNQSLVSFTASPGGSPDPVVTITTIQEGGEYTAFTIEGGSTFDLGIRKTSTQVVTWVLGIPYDASAAEVETYINAALGESAVSCTGGPLPDTAVVITFDGGSYAGISIAPTIYRLAFTGTAGQSFQNELVRTARTPSSLENAFDFTIIPGRGTLGLNLTDSWNVLTTDCNWGSFNLEIPGLGRMASDRFRWVDATALDIENVINEMFGKDVCRVYQTVHSQEWTQIPNVYGGGTVTSNRGVWYFRDVYRIVFHTDFALPESITSLTFEFPTVFTSLEEGGIEGSYGPNCFFKVLNTEDYDDYTNESMRVYSAFALADQSGNPLHNISIAPGVVVDDHLTFRFKLITDYYDNIYVESSSGSSASSIPRAVHAEIPTDMKVYFNWVRRPRTQTQEGATQRSSDQVLASSVLVDWDATPEAFAAALANMQPVSTVILAGPNNFFGLNNLAVTGGLRNSDLMEGYEAAELEDSYQDLRVTLTGILYRMPFDESDYFLDMVIYDNRGSTTSKTGNPTSTPTAPQAGIQFNWPMPWSDIVCRPIPPLINERQRISIDLTDLTGDLQLSYDGTVVDVAAGDTAQEIETALLSILGSFDDVLARLLPGKWGKAVSVFGTTLGDKPFEVEFTGYGYQYRDVMPIKMAITNDDGSILLITTTQEGVDPRPEIQTIQITGSPYAGAQKLTISGDETGSISFDALAAVVEAELEGLAGIGASNVAVTGGPFPALMTVTFAPALGNVATMVSTVLSAFKNQRATITEFQPGGSESETSLLLEEVVRGAGPRFFDVPENYHDNACVSSGDTVVVDDAVSPIQFGIRGFAQAQIRNLGGVSAPTVFFFANRRRVFLDGQKVWVSSDGTLPVGLTAGYYYIINGDSDMTFSLSAVDGDVAANWVHCTDPGIGPITLTLRELTFKVYSRYSGNQIGLPNRRANGELEYLATYLQAGFTLIDVGIEEGDGLSLGKFDTLDQPAHVLVRQTGTGSSSSIPAVLLLFNNATSTMQMLAGEVGMAVYPAEEVLMGSWEQMDGSLVVGKIEAVDGYTKHEGEMRVLEGVTGGTFSIA